MEFFRLVEEDLRFLSSECKKKHPEVKDSAEKAMQALRETREKYAKALSVEHAPKVEDFRNPFLIDPFLLAANHVEGSSKVLITSLSGIQRLITANSTRPEDTANIVRVLVIQSESTNTDIQLKVMQTLVLLMTTSQKLDIDDEVLSQSLEICFRLHMMPKAIIHNSAAATLSQVITILYDRVKLEPPHSAVENVETTSTRAIASAGAIAGNPSLPPLEGPRKSAYLLFQDLCLQSRGLTPLWLKKVMISKELGLELLDTIMVKEPDLFRNSDAFLCLLRDQVCPLLITNLEWEQDLGLVIRQMKLTATLLTGFGDLLLPQIEPFVAIMINTLAKRDEIDRRNDQLSASQGAGQVLSDKASSQRGSKQSSSVHGNKTAESIIAEWRIILTVEVLNRMSQKFELLQMIFGFYDASTTRADVVTSIVIAVVDYVQKTSQRGIGLTQSGSTPSRTLESLLTVDPEHAVPDLHASFRQAVNCILGLATGMESSAKIASATQNGTEGLSEMVEVIFQPLIAGISSVLTYCENSQLLVDTILHSALSIGLTCGYLHLDRLRDMLVTYLCAFALSMKTPGGLKTNSSSLWKSTQCFRIVLDIAKGLDYNIGNAWGPLLETLDEFESLYSSKQIPQASGIDLEREFSSLSSSGKNLFETSRNWSDEALIQGALALSGFSSFCLGLVEDLRIEKFSPTSRTIRPTISVQAKNPLSIQDIQKSASSLPDSLANPITAAAAVAAAAAAAAVKDTKKRGQSGKNLINTTEASYVWKTPTYLTMEPTYVFGQPRVSCKTPPYSFKKLVDVCRGNIFRIGLVWPTVADHLILVSSHRESSIRQFVTDCYSQLLISSMTYNNSAEKPNPKYLSPLEIQDHLVRPMESFIVSSFPEVQESTLQGLNTLLQSCGHLISGGWPILLNVLKQVALAATRIDPQLLEGSDQSSDLSIDPSLTQSGSSKRPPPSGARIKLGFTSVQLIVDDFLHSIPPNHVNLCLECVGSYGGQGEDINVCLTAINLLWATADFLNNKQKSMDESAEQAKKKMDDVWRKLFDELQRLSLDTRPEVRNCALNTLISTACALGNQFQPAQWRGFCLDIFLPLLGKIDFAALAAIEDEKDGKLAIKSSQKIIVHHSRDSAEKQWNETRVLGIQGVVRIVRMFYRAIQSHDWFLKVWEATATICFNSITKGEKKREVALAGVSGLQVLLQIVSINGLSQSGTVRAAAGMRVVNGALTCSEEPSSSLEKKPEVNELNDIANPALWALTWGFYPQLVRLEGDEDGDIKAAIVKSLSTIYTCSRDHEFQKLENLNSLLDIVFTLTSSSFQMSSKSGRFVPSVNNVQKEALQFYKELPPLCDVNVWSKVFSHLLSYKLQPAVNPQLLRDINRTISSIYNEKTLSVAKAKSLFNLFHSVSPLDSDSNGENSSNVELLSQLVTYGIPSLSEGEEIVSEELLKQALLEAIRQFALPRNVGVECKPGGIFQLTPDWPRSLVYNLVDGIKSLNGRTNIPVSVQDALLSLLVSGTSSRQGTARDESGFELLCLEKLAQLCYDIAIREDFRQRSSLALLDCIIQSISKYIECSKSNDKAVQFQASEVALRVLYQLLSILHNPNSRDLGSSLILQLFPLLCELILAEERRVREIVREVFLESGIHQLATQELRKKRSPSSKS